MNNDLISRKALVAALLEEREHYPPETAERYSFGVKLPNRFNQAMRGGIRKALRLIEIAKAVDAEPVRHGRWMPRTYSISECSVCGKLHFAHEDSWNYCPNCGAKMDGDSND